MEKLQRMRELKDTISGISLFSGAMGLDIGLEQAGVHIYSCVEQDPFAVETIRHNRPNIAVIDRDITTVSGKEILKNVPKGKNIDTIVGGPPCQAFSVFGKRHGLKDKRGAVILDYLRLVEEIQPTTFLMENVRGLLSMPLQTEEKASPYAKKGGLFKWLIEEFERLGYRTDAFVVNSVNYGTPQIRERILVFGNKYNETIDFPEPWYSNRPEDGLPPFRTLGDVIGSKFTDPDSDCMNFSERKLKYLAMVPEGGNWRHLPIEVQKESMGKAWYLKGGRSAYWRKLSFDYPSPTLTTMPNHAGTSMCHPTKLRALTVGEYAAIQEFPSDWKFFGSATDKCRQIGNAVPVRLGKVAGEVLKKLIFKCKKWDSPVLPTIPSSLTHIRPHVRTRSFWRNGETQDGHASYVQTVIEEKQLAIF
jgi:DNA (cytosine-5)-methyltransferase 1